MPCPELRRKSRRSTNWLLSTAALATILFLAPPTVYPQSSKDSAPKTSTERPEPERGYAAFYGPSLEGHKTACGGTYSADKFTAAHRKLPCGTKLRVTNLRNGKTVRVIVTDHGPTSRDRIIDLSYAAARSLNFTKQGTTLVKIEVLR